LSDILLTAFLLGLLAFCGTALALEGDEISFDFEYSDPASFDIAKSAMERNFYTALDAEKYKAVGAFLLIQETSLRLKSDDTYRVMLVCSQTSPLGRCRDIQLAIVDERKTPAVVIQRIRLGDGDSPQILWVGADEKTPSAAMFRVIRERDNTEARIYSANPVTGRLAETLVVDRAYPERLKLDVSGTMKEGGIIEISSKDPPRNAKLDLTESVDALIEDELFQPDGRPISALVNLKLVRGGWEDERLYIERGRHTVEVGMSLVSLSKQTVADVTAIMTQNEEDDSWAVTDLRFEPSLPYRSE
jgi:hypothetical protein